MTRRERAMANFYAGYNCAQSVALAFDDLTGVDAAVLARLSAPFGGGMGRLREVCGAVSGMFMVLGALDDSAQPLSQTDKAALYARVQALAGEFEERHGSIVCRELLGLTEKRQPPTPEARTEAYYRKRPCPAIIGDAAAILEAALESHN